MSRGRAGVALAGAIACIAGGLLAPTPAAASAAGSAGFNTPGRFEWVVPEGVFSADFSLVGGGGSFAVPEPAANGGRSGTLTATLSVTPGDTYYIYVGTFFLKLRSPSPAVRGDIVARGTILNDD